MDQALWFPNRWLCTKTEFQGIPVWTLLTHLTVGNLCLVTFEREGEVINARLDMAKEWFVDPVPFCQAEAQPVIKKLIRTLMES
jgi:hypothetical protein